jgi:hypothetical protein
MPKKNANGKPGTQPVNLTLDAKPDTHFYYVNYMSVVHGPYDFTISAIRIPTSFTQEQTESVKKGQTVSIEPAVQLVIPPRVARGLVRALQDQIQKFDNLQKVIDEQEQKQ